MGFEGVTLVNAILKFVAPSRTLAKRTQPLPAENFQSFFKKSPEGRTFEERVVFNIWLRELVQSRKSSVQILDELTKAGFPPDLIKRFANNHQTPKEILEDIEFAYFADPTKRAEIQRRATECLNARNKRRWDIYPEIKYWLPNLYNLEALEKETQSMGPNTRLLNK